MSADEPRLVSREDVRRFARKFGVPAEQVDDALVGLTFPATLDQVEERLAQLGVTRGGMMDEMGGSP